MTLIGLGGLYICEDWTSGVGFSFWWNAYIYHGLYDLGDV